MEEDVVTCGVCTRLVARDITRFVFDPFAIFDDSKIPVFEICDQCLYADINIFKMVNLNDDRFMGHAIYVYTEEE